MRIAAISDVHGNLDALSAVLADIRRRDCDLVVNLGDILSGPLQPAETADLLMSLDLTTIRGNHERQLLETPPERMGESDAHAYAELQATHLDWLARLPATRALDDEVFLCHGTPRDDLEYFLETVEPDGLRAATEEEIAERIGDCTAAVILCGHTHVPRIARLSSGTLVVNPGSVGLQAYHMDVPYPHNVENDDPRARYAVIERVAGVWQAESVAVAYDHEAAAALAAGHRRPDWAHALRTGRVLPCKES